MALRAMYKGIKKVLTPLIINRPGELAIDQDALVEDLDPVFFPRSEQAVLGAKNLHPKYKNVTIGNAVMSVDNDGICTITGTSGSGNGIISEFVLDLPAGRYTLTDEAIHADVACCQIYNITKSETYWTPNNNTTFEYNGTDTLKARIWLKGGLLTLNEVLKPMLRLASDPDSTYAPYAMTNKELTDAVETLNGSVSDQKTAINAIITAATGAADFAAFKTAMGAITPVTRSIQVTPEIREEITEPEDEPVVKKTTRKKSTAKADTEKEGE